MESNIYKLCLASSFSLFCLFTPKTATAQEIFPSTNNFGEQYQQVTVNSVTSITRNLHASSTTSTTNISKITNNPNQNVTAIYSRNLQIKSSQSQAVTGLAAKGGKRPPRKG